MFVQKLKISNHHHHHRENHITQQHGKAIPPPSCGFRPVAPPPAPSPTVVGLPGAGALVPWLTPPGPTWPRKSPPQAVLLAEGRARSAHSPREPSSSTAKPCHHPAVASDPSLPLQRRHPRWSACLAKPRNAVVRKMQMPMSPFDEPGLRLSAWGEAVRGRRPPTCHS